MRRSTMPIAAAVMALAGYTQGDTLIAAEHKTGTEQMTAHRFDDTSTLALIGEAALCVETMRAIAEKLADTERPREAALLFNRALHLKQSIDRMHPLPAEKPPIKFDGDDIAP